MSIFSLSFMDAIKDRMFEYFWKKYLGEFLLDSQSLKSSKWTFSDGKLGGQIGNVYLDAASLNARISNLRPPETTTDDAANATNFGDSTRSNSNTNLMEQPDSLDLPIVFTEHAYLRQIEAELPWSRLLAEDCRIRIDGAQFEMRLNMSSGKSKPSSIEHLMASSMDFDLGSPSLQIAEELIENAQMDARKQDSRLEGLEMLANVIESVLRRVQFTLTDTSITLVNQSGTSKLKFHIQSAVWRKEEDEEARKGGSHNDSKTSELYESFTNESSSASTGSSPVSPTDQNKSTENEKFVRTVQISGVEISLNGVSIVKLEGQHTVRLTLGQSKSIHIFFGSLIYAILTPQQLHEILKIFQSPDDALIVDPKLINFKDLLNQKLITEQDYRRIEQQLQIDKAVSQTTSAIPSSNNLNVKLNQIWSTSGIEPEDDSSGEKFFPFKNHKTPNRLTTKGLCDTIDDDHEQSPFVDVFVDLPGIVFCLLSNQSTPIEAVSPDFNSDLQSICRHLDERLLTLDHLRVCILNGQIVLHPDRINCTFSDVLFSECSPDHFEHILFNETREKTDKDANFELQYCFSENELCLKSAVPTTIQFDMTLVERLEKFLQLEKNRSIFNLSDEPIELADAIRVERSRVSSKDPSTESYRYEAGGAFTFKMEAPALAGRLFFPVPDMSFKHQKSFSQIRDETLEATFKNSRIEVCGKRVRLDADFVELALNSKYVPHKSLHRIRYMVRPLLHLNGDAERLVNAIPEVIECLNGVPLAQLRCLGPNSRVEFTLDLCPTDTARFLDNIGFKARTENCQSASGLTGMMMEDSIYVTAAAGLKAERPSEFQSKRRIVKDQEEVEQIVAPNDRQQSSDYLNCASLVADMVVQLAIPQLIVLFNNQDELNSIYNRFVNDIALWKPFNLYNNVDQTSSNLKNSDISDTLATSPGPEIDNHDDDDCDNRVEDPLCFEQEFHKFDMSRHRSHHYDQSSRSHSAADGSNLGDTDEWDPNINIADFSNDDDDFHHFEISDTCKPPPVSNPRTHHKTRPASYYLCKSGLEESSDSEVSFHSTAESPNDQLEYFVNAFTLICKVRETVISLETPPKSEDGRSKDKTVHNLVGNNLLLGCVLTMSQCNNATRMFLHTEDLTLCVASTDAPVTRIQAVSATNRQVRLITCNRLVNQREKCRLNAGFEIAFESPKVKRIRIVIQLQHGLLLQPNVEQFAQFWQFMNVTDDVIVGYEPAKVLIELHVNLMDTAIMIEHACSSLNPAHETSDKYNSTPCFDCQHPLQLKHRPALIVCDELSITCLLLEGTEDTLLRFIFEETALMFAKKVTDIGDLFPTDGRQCLDRFMRFGALHDTTNLFNALQLDRFVCAVNCDLLELNVKINDGHPKEVRLNNNMINIRGCADLLAALCCFSARFAGSDDTCPSPPETSKPPTSSTPTAVPHSHEPTTVTRLNSAISNRHVAPLFDQRILEDEERVIPTNVVSRRPCNCDPAADFSFVDTNAAGKASVTNRSGSPQSLDESSFFILGDDDFGTGIKKSPEPEIRMLTNDPIIVRDNHFAISKQSITPPFTENNESRFLLDDMSICLHLFGGRDFYEDFQSISGKTVDPRARTFETGMNVQKPSVRFADTADTKLLLDDVKLAKYSKFEVIALNFGRTLEFYALSGFSTLDFQHAGQALWEDLDLLQPDIPESFSSQISSKGSGISSFFTSNPNGTKALSLNAAKVCGGFARNSSLYVKTFLMKMRCLFDTYRSSHPVAWRFLFSVHELEVRDCARNSQINKMLYEYISDSLPRRNNHMLTINATTMRVPASDQTIPVYAPGDVQFDRGSASLDESRSTEECDLKISLKPLRINIDQDTIMFVIEFFNQLSLYLENACTDELITGTSSSGDDLDEPIDKLIDQTDLFDDSASDMLLDYHSKRFSEDQSDTCSIKSGLSTTSTRDPNRRPLFVRSFLFSPDVPIKLDYQGKHVDFDQGPIAGILIGLAQLNQSELTLKRIHHKYGILGFEKVFLYALNCWLQDIKKHQLPSILGGVGPAHSFVQLFQGIRDLFWLPIDQYRRDRRIVRGLQRGIFSFSTCSTIALLELSSRTLRLIEFTAQSAHDFMSGNSLRRERMLSARYDCGGRVQQPRDVREGALSAYNVISDGFYQAFRNLTVGHSRHNSSAIAHIIRELPANVLLPIIHSSQATSNVLLGVRNQMTPQARKEDEDKWKS